jgi:hypothetical protein
MLIKTATNYLCFMMRVRHSLIFSHITTQAAHKRPEKKSLLLSQTTSLVHADNMNKRAGNKVSEMMFVLSFYFHMTTNRKK